MSGRPKLEPREWENVHKALLRMQEKDVTQMAATGFIHWFNDAYPECFRGVMNRFLFNLQTCNIWTNEKLGTTAELRERCARARVVEDLIMRLRETTTSPIWVRAAQDVKPADVPFRILSDIKELFRAAAQMGPASPMRKSDPELLFFFQHIADYDPIKRRNKMLETLIHDAKRAH